MCNRRKRNLGIYLGSWLRQNNRYNCATIGLSIGESGVLHMMMTIQSLQGKLKRRWARLLTDPRVQTYGRGAAYVLGGLGLSAAALFHYPVPLAMGLVCGCSGFSAVLAAAGSIFGYLLFWGSGGGECILWVSLGLLATLFFSRQRRRMPALLPAIAGLIVSACGVAVSFWLGQNVPVEVYLCRVLLALGSAWLFWKTLQGRDPVVDWLTVAAAVLALSQLSFGVWANFGILAGAMITVTGAFPAAALAGVALDLAGISTVSMTAVFCVAFLVRFLPECPRWLRSSACAGIYILMLRLAGEWALYPLPMLLVGGFLGVWLPLPRKRPARRGETGVAQVRLEMAAGALYQTEQLLLEQTETPIDEDAILQRAAQTACSGCACRGNCKDSRRIAQLPSALLHKPLLSVQELPIICRKSGRFLAELHRAQEQLRSIRADRQHREECRAAVLQQYGFLREYLQQLSDQLGRKAEPVRPCYDVSVEVFSNRRGGENGDRCAVFTGIRDLQYVVLCDGMGTGTGAAWEARAALQLLRRLLTAGYPGSAALRSLNSLCALRGRAGAVTVDLLELELCTGKARLYKWGAAPSYLQGALGWEKIGVPSPPPGLSVTEQTELQHTLRLRRGERLVLLSDGVDQNIARQYCGGIPSGTAGELARCLLRHGSLGNEDDATVVIVQLAEADT